MTILSLATRNILLLLGCIASSNIHVAIAISNETEASSSELFGGGKENNAAIARWLIQKSIWGTLNAPFPWHISSKEVKRLKSTEGDDTTTNASGTIIPFAQNEGRIYLYLMGQHDDSIEEKGGVSLTVSQASLNSDLFALAGCGTTTDAAVDAQDPRCAKLTLTGSIASLSSDDSDNGLDALFKTHPNMESWPESHDFRVHELILEDIWMISGFGGGGNIDVDDYFGADPVQQHDMIGADAVPKNLFKEIEHDSPPSKYESKGAARARWIVHNSLWTTVSTISSLSSTSSSSAVAFGNIRSIADGYDESHSTGKPIFYLPTPDPTSKDIEQNPQITLTFSEAAFGSEISTCGNDPSSLECGQVILRGKAIKVKEDYDDIMNAFATTHPLAPWLSSGDGSHTGGDYYTIGEIEQVSLIFHFGSTKNIKPNDYLEYQFPEHNDNEEEEESYGSSSGHNHNHHHKNHHHGGERRHHHQISQYDRVDMVFSWIGGLLLGIIATLGFMRYQFQKKDNKYNQIFTGNNSEQQLEFEIEEPKGTAA